MADTMHALEKNPNWKGRRGPVVLVIMDGVGYGKYEEGDAVKASKMKAPTDSATSAQTTLSTSRRLKSTNCIANCKTIISNIQLMCLPWSIRWLQSRRHRRMLG